ncbi:MAG TPA: N-acetylglutamate synthase, partial [Myxococcales bacterium]|nr:N-acetylglutamate synthase [Myxococcales bacterium]
GIAVLRGGRPVTVDEEAATRALSQEEVRIHVRLPGNGVGRAWGCDLTAGYVRINADYRS